MALKYFSFTLRTQFDFDPFPILSKLHHLHRLDITDAKIITLGDIECLGWQLPKILEE